MYRPKSWKICTVSFQISNCFFSSGSQRK